MTLSGGVIEGDAKLKTIDEIKKNNEIPIGMDEELFEKKVAENMDERFTQLRTLIFVKDKRNPNHAVARLPKGKIVFPDKSVDVSKLKLGVPYICLVYEREREAFAKILGEQYEPRIIVTETGLVLVILRTGNKVSRIAASGGSLHERLWNAYKIIKESGSPTVRLIIRENEPIREGNIRNSDVVASSS